jgi:hypothetical protein
MASVLDAYCTYFLYLSIGMHASIFVRNYWNTCVIPFHELSLLPSLGRTLDSLRQAYLAQSGSNHGYWLMFCRIVSLEDPSRRMLMMVQECTSTYYVLF